MSAPGDIPGSLDVRYASVEASAIMNSMDSSPVTLGKRYPTGRRAFMRLSAATALAPSSVTAQERRFTIAFANLTDDPGARIDGLGFTGQDVRSSFVLGARGLPVELVLYDNARERAKSIANADDAVRRKVNLYINFCDDPAANAEIAKRGKR